MPLHSREKRIKIPYFIEAVDNATIRLFKQVESSCIGLAYVVLSVSISCSGKRNGTAAFQQDRRLFRANVARGRFWCLASKLLAARQGLVDWLSPTVFTWSSELVGAWRLSTSTVHGSPVSP